MIRKFSLIIISTIIFIGCNDKNKYSHAKFYDYIIDNQLPSQVVKIVPKEKDYFWISSSDTIFVYPKTQAIIGSTSKYDNNRKVIDCYQQNDTIVKFDVFIDSIKQEKVFSQRFNWTFVSGSVDESAIYTLTINQENIVLK